MLDNHEPSGKNAGAAPLMHCGGAMTATEPEVRSLKHEVIAFADSLGNAVPPASEPVDRRIARLLWIWRRDPERVLDDGRDVQRHLASLLEPFLCDTFTYHSEGSKQGWWSDGVMDLRVQQIGSTVFRTMGSTWWADRKDGAWVGPFEIEFHFAVEEEQDFARTIVRFGWKDKNGNIIRSSSCLHPRLRRDGLQARESNWAMAIELTPPKNRLTGQSDAAESK